jgi:hypothetical protein
MIKQKSEANKSLRREVHDGRADNRESFQEVKRGLNHMNRHPAQVIHNSNSNSNNNNSNTTDNMFRAPDDDEEVNDNAWLSKAPKDLYQLWDEWVNGLGGRKPASSFTPVKEEDRNMALQSVKSFGESVQICSVQVCWRMLQSTKYMRCMDRARPLLIY